MLPELKRYITETENEASAIPASRKEKLLSIAEYIRSAEPARLLFICTHNSRRSLLCQAWTAALAAHYNLDGVEAWSGGTEATAFHPRAVAALRRAGFQVEKAGENTNPRYRVSFSGEGEPLTCFSKIYGHPHNPQDDFAAVMVCASADRRCPAVPGSSRRFSLPYEDPGEADGTGRETEIYDRCCRRIAVEMGYMLKEV